MDFRRGHEGADAAAALDDALALKEGESVARGHEADVMRLGEVALRGNRVAGPQLAGVDALANDALNALIRRQRIRRARGEALDGGQSLFVRSHQVAPFSKHFRQKNVSAERKREEFAVASILRTPLVL